MSTAILDAPSTTTTGENPYKDSPTKGWDTVFALNVKEINAAIAASKDIPKAFSYTLPDQSVRVDGNYAPWSVFPGGGGSTLKLAVPLSGGTLTIKPGTPKSQVISFGDLQCVCEVELDFFEQKNITLESPGKKLDLKVNTGPRTDGKKPISAITLVTKSDDLNFYVAAEAPEALEGWLNGHPEIFEHIFTTITLNDEIDTGDFAWTTPTSVAYAYAEKVDAGRNYIEGSGLLAVLCMTQGRKITQQPLDVSPNAIPDGKSAAFVVSKERILETLLLPNICKAFQGLQATDFEMAEDGDSVNLRKGSVIPFTATTDDGKTHKGQINALSVSVSDQNITMHAESTATISPFLTAHTKSDHQYTIGLQTHTDGTQTLAFNAVGNATTDQWATDDNSMSTIQGVGTMLGLLALAILSVVTEGAAMVVACVIVSILSSAFLWAPMLIEAVGKGDAPDICDLLLHVNQHITWTGGKNFTLTDATLNDSLQLTGDFKD